MEKLCKIIFRHNNTETALEVPSGTALLDAARASGVDIDAPCGGAGVCGKCKVRLVAGSVESEKNRHLSEDEYESGIRLACCSRVVSDAVIEIPDTAGSFRYGIVTADFSTEKEQKTFDAVSDALSALGLPKVQNGYRLLHLTVSEPTLDDTMPDIERVKAAVTEKTGADTIVFSSVFVRKAAYTLRENAFSFALSVEIRPDGSVFVYDILPPDADKICGVAIDIGTTTVTAVLCDLITGRILARASAGNAQIQYGADVINRIINSVKKGGSERLRKAVVDDTLRPMIARMCAHAGVETGSIVKLTVASNTTMNHLLTGCFADPIRMEPYIPTFFETDAFRGRDFSFGVHPDAPVLFAPNVGSYVGGDITAGTLSSRLWSEEKMSLFVDLGTNGEMVFGNSDFMMCCACSAGPAFEGGDVHCGMRATVGAVDSIVIDKDTMEPKYTMIGESDAPEGICGSGIIDTVAELFRTGIISPKGTFIREGERIKHDESGIGRYIIAFSDGVNREIYIDEVDIQNFIRAKGAIFSAVMTMLKSLDMDASMIESIIIAGGIGSGLDIGNAVSIGMLPKIDEECYTYIGNSSLSGAVCMLLSDPAREKTEEIGRSMTYIELSTQPGYMDEFVAACFLPHTDASLFE